MITARPNCSRPCSNIRVASFMNCMPIAGGCSPPGSCSSLSAGWRIYGVVVGSLSGGAQLWIAPVKLALGTLLAVLICLPSLYIFSCLAGSEFRLRAVAGVLAAAVCLSSLLLIGFAPVAWIFSQSTDSLPFMGTLHLLFWLIGLSFGLRLLGGMNRFRGESGGGRLKSWSLIFILVCLQMTTTLRPIIGHSDHFLPREKKFFPHSLA